MRQRGLCNLHKVSGSAMQKFVQHFPLTKSARYGIMVISPRIRRARPAIIAQAGYFVNTFFEKNHFYFTTLIISSHSAKVLRVILNITESPLIVYLSLKLLWANKPQAAASSTALSFVFFTVKSTKPFTSLVAFFTSYIVFNLFSFFLYIVYHIFYYLSTPFLWKVWALCPQSSFHFFVLLKAISQNFLFD